MSTTQINNHQSLLHLSNCEVALDETVRNTIFIANSREAFRAHENWIWRFILTFCFFGVYHERSRMVKEREKNNTKFIPILFFILQSLICNLQSAAQNYPVQITTQLTPPFSGYVSDYATPGNQNLKILVYLIDFTMPLYDVKFKVKIEGQGITLQSKPFYYSSPFSLVPGQPLELSGSDLAGLLNSNNLDFSGISKSQYDLRKVLPEGYYKICFTAYDNNNPTQIKVSNESCAMAWMVLSDPPFLNTPVCNSTVTITNPQNILFNWTPMNMASPNSAADTEYGFSLYEVRPDGQNPNNIIQTLPPIFTTTVNTPFFNYGITETQLIAGMQYVWRVRAIDVSGRDLFKNQGYSQICTFNWGTKYEGMGNLDIFLGATPLTHRSAKLAWDSIPIFTNYHLEYRKAGSNWNWMPVNTTNTRTKVFDLEPETDYEARVNGSTNDGYTGQWSNVASFRTPPTPIINCEDVAPPPSMRDFQPLTKATVGSIWEIGQFEVIVTSLQNTQSTSGQYSGQGRVLLPFGGLGIIGNFTNLTVNNNHVVVAGHIDAITKGVDKWQNNFDQLQAQENATYVDGTITSVTVNSNGEYCYTTQINPQPICVPTPTNANVLAVRDSDGNEYTITLVPLPAKVTGPKNYLNNTTDNLEITDSLTVTFEASSNQSFGFDKKEYTAYSSNYEMYTTPSNKKYFIPYKSISEGQTDEVLANIQINNFNQANLSFKTQSGTALNSTSLTTTQFKITGIPSAAGCVYAYYNNKKIGKLNIVSLKSITKKLILVPVNNTTLNSQTQQQLNNIYKQANVSWNVTAASSFTFNLGGDGLEAADATLLTKYSTEMRALRDAYKQATPNYDKDAYYIFVVPNFSDPQLKGYMVRGRALGFVSSNASANEIAHELAHGAFGLEHTFPKIEQSTTNNLLDYGSGQQLIKMQWEEMQNPTNSINWSDKEEDASLNVDQNKIVFAWLNKIKTACKNNATIPLNTIISAKTENTNLMGVAYDYIEVWGNNSSGKLVIAPKGNITQELYHYTALEQKDITQPAILVTYNRHCLNVDGGKFRIFAPLNRLNLLKLYLESPAVNKNLLLFVNGYRDNAPNPVENPNSTNDIYTGDIFGYWEGIDAQFINRINTRNVIYADGHHSIITSNHNVNNSSSQSIAAFLGNTLGSTNAANAAAAHNYPLPSFTLHTTPNTSGFLQRKNAGETAAQKLLSKITNGEIVFNKQTDTLDIVCHSMGYAYAVGMIETLKLGGIAHFGRIYIIAPENASSGAADWNLFEEVWQYGSNLDQPNADPLYLQDGVAPQTMIKDIDRLQAPTIGGRAFIPDGSPKGFVESHKIRNYGWIFTERKKDMDGYVKPRK